MITIMSSKFLMLTQCSTALGEDDAMAFLSSGRWVPTFRRNLFPTASHPSRSQSEHDTVCIDEMRIFNDPDLLLSLCHRSGRSLILSLWWGGFIIPPFGFISLESFCCGFITASLSFIGRFSHFYAVTWSLIPLQHTIISEPLTIHQETLIRPCVHSILFTCYLFNDAKNNSRIWRPMLTNVEL
jgi:hypothetical protein